MSNEMFFGFAMLAALAVAIALMGFIHIAEVCWHNWRIRKNK